MTAGGPGVATEVLEALRRHGFGVAYRMLGSVSEAEDVAQEALLRLTRHESPIREPAAWMTTVATRLSINVLRSARARRESYLLREVFGYEYAEVADIIERTEANSRQLVTRARKHIDASRSRFDADEAAHDVLLERFLAAAEEGDLEGLEQLLAKDAVLYADGGGKAIAPPDPLFGAELVARFLISVARMRRAMGEFEHRLVSVNGGTGRLLRVPGDRAFEVLTLGVVDGRIQTIRIVRNPDKLAHL
jgi:RNA polymerase sigma-70 factor, ECF subfamily